MIGDTTGYGTSSAKTAPELLEKAGVKPVYCVLIDPNKTDLTDEMTKAKAAGADVVMPWSAATGLLARLLNTRGDMGWDVPVVGHPALMALPIEAAAQQARILGEHLRRRLRQHHLRAGRQAAAADPGAGRQDAPAPRRQDRASPSGGWRWATTA